MKVGITKNISSLVKATDSDGDIIRSYGLTDTSGIDNFVIGETVVKANPGYILRSEALKNLNIRGDESGSSQRC